MGFEIENGVLKKYTGGEYLTVIVPEGVTEIGKQAFFGSGLDGKFGNGLAAYRIVLPNSVKIIGESAFSGCTILKEINIPDSVTEIGNDAFKDVALEKVHMPDVGNWLNIKITGSGSHISFWTSTPISIASDVDFNGQSSETVIIPEGHEKIREYAFVNLVSMKRVVIPGSVREIGEHAFSNCKALEEIDISDGVTKIGTGAFSYCQSLRKIVLPDSVVEIGCNAFEKCANLSEVRLSDNLTEIGGGAFGYCTSLHALRLPEGLRTLGNDVFENSGIEKIVIPGSMEVLAKSLLSKCSELKEVIIQPGIKEIHSYGFWRDDKLKSITIPDSVKKIGADSFEGCVQLTEVHISSLQAWLEIGFQDKNSNPCSCYSAYMGFGVDYAKRTEDAYLFVDGKKLEGTVELPEGIKAIGNYAFNRCAGISRVIIPDGVESIGAYAFAGCKDLKEIRIPDSVKEIGERAFCSTPLTSLCIPSESIEKIGPGIVSACDDLDRLELHSLPKSMDKDALTNKPAMVLQIPEGTLATKAKLPVTLCSADIAASDDELAWVILFQKAKAWTDWISKKEMKDPDKVFGKMLEICDKETRAPLDVLAEYVDDHLKTISPDLIRNAVTLLEKKKYKDISALKKRPEVKTILSGKAIKENPIEARVRELCAKHPLSDEALKAVKKGIPYAGSRQTSSREAVAFILSEYAKEWSRCSGDIIFERYNTSSDGIKDGTKLVIHPEADEVAEALDRKSLISFFEYLSSDIHYRPWLLAWARYADDNSVDIWTSYYKTEIKGKAKEYYKAYSMRECLLINDTVAAMRFFDRIGDLDRYAKMRGRTAMEIRDSIMLPDFGLNEHGIKTFDTGDSIIEASITPDLGLKLYDSKAQKEIRSFPKKGENQKKLKAATEQFDEFKNSILGFTKARTELIHKMHISGEYISQASWTNVYLNHPVIRYLTELLIWQDRKGNTFIVSDGAVRNIQGEVIAPEGDIRVAHVLDMDEKKILEWQQYLAETGKKQLFDQIWEPIVKWDQDSIGSRYSNAVITYQDRNALKKALKQRGIDAGSADMAFDYHPRGGFSFTNEGKMQIGDCLSIEYLTDPDKKQVTFKRTRLWNENKRREINAELLELDKAVVSSRIAEDNDAALPDSTLSRFTVSQITAFLNQAIKCKATKCTAVLLDYKNRHFPEYADINEFSLDW